MFCLKIQSTKVKKNIKTSKKNYKLSIYILIK